MPATQANSQTGVRSKALLAIYESLFALKDARNGSKVNRENISPEARTSLRTWAQGKQDQTLSWWA